MTVRAMLSADRSRFTIRTGQWRGTFEVSSLDNWINLYHDLANRPHPRFGGYPYRGTYAPIIKALERVKEKLEC